MSERVCEYQTITRTSYHEMVREVERLDQNGYEFVPGSIVLSPMSVSGGISCGHERYYCMMRRCVDVHDE